MVVWRFEVDGLVLNDGPLEVFDSVLRAVDRGEIAGYPSHSEADLALCNLLAFWTGGDPARMERLFAQSGLVRAKWRNRPDYRERTI